MRPRQRVTRHLVVPLLVLIVLLGASCASDDSVDEQATDATPSDETSDGSDTAEENGEGGALGHPDGTDPLHTLPDDVALPIVFVHGFAGSAQQYESQAMRFIANGYPDERIVAYDHDGAGLDLPAYTEGVDEVIDAALAELDADQVYLVGHSRGTGVSSAHVSDPERAAKVAKYVAVDGAPCPQVVECIAITQADLPGQAHVEVATSAESFALQYEFLVGEAPEVTEIVPQRDPVVVSGRAVEFPSNRGRDGATLDIWSIDADTGQRTADEPHASFELDADGDFGPVEVETGAHYEYVLSTPETDIAHHLYLQPYVRSSHLVRLLSSEPDGDIRTNTNSSDGHAALVAIRMREWYGDGQDADVLEISTAETEPVDVITDFVGNGGIGLHLHDSTEAPGETTLEPITYFAEQPFQTGIDVFIPASADGSGTITVTNLPRGDTDRPQTLNVPDWPSSRHTISVMFADWAVDQPTTG